MKANKEKNKAEKFKDVFDSWLQYWVLQLQSVPVAPAIFMVLSHRLVLLAPHPRMTTLVPSESDKPSNFMQEIVQLILSAKSELKGNVHKALLPQ